MSRVWQLLSLLVVAGIVAAAAYFVLASPDSSGDSSAVQPTGVVGPPAAIAASQLMVRAVDRNNPLSNGRVFLLEGGHPRLPAGPQLDCERVYYAAGRGLCLATAETDSGYETTIFDSSMGVLYRLPLGGVPSRARVSSDGRYGATTAFVNGHAYLENGGFSTETTILDMRTGQLVGNLETFEVTKGGRPFRREDFNFWGVTFARDSNRFYATLRTNGRYYLVEGNVRERKLRVVRSHVECPSLSPDGTRIGYKSRIGNENRWQLKVLDLVTMRSHDVAEHRPINDQVEWLDDDTLVYSDGFDVYTVPADGSGAPRLVVRDASSPVALRE